MQMEDFGNENYGKNQKNEAMFSDAEVDAMMGNIKEKKEILDELAKQWKILQVSIHDINYKKLVRSHGNEPNDELPYVYPNLTLEELDKEIKENEGKIEKMQDEYNTKLKESGFTELDVIQHHMKESEKNKQS